MELLKVRHNWPEHAGFSLSRPSGAKTYILLHFHNAVELTFGGRTRKTAPGALIVFAPNTPHGFVSRTPLVHDWMHLSGDVSGALAAVGLSPDTLYQPTCGATITSLTARLEAELFAQRPYWPLYRDALMTELLVQLSYNLSGEETAPVQTPMADRLRELRYNMLLHPEHPWTNEHMAQQLNVSVSRLYPLYRRMFAISPNRDLILMRIERAKTMLEQGASVAQAAEMTGYANVSHFSRQFSQVVGVNPGQYARLPRAGKRPEGGAPLPDPTIFKGD